MEDVLKLCGAVAISSVAVIVLKKLGSDVASALVITIVVGALALALPKVREIVGAASNLAPDGFSEYLPIIIKSAAVAIICEICSDVASATGETALSKSVMFVCKIEIVYLSLPLVKMLCEIASSFGEIK